MKILSGYTKKGGKNGLHESLFFLKFIKKFANTNMSGGRCSFPIDSAIPFTLPLDPSIPHLRPLRSVEMVILALTTLTGRVENLPRGRH